MKNNSGGRDIYFYCIKNKNQTLLQTLTKFNEFDKRQTKSSMFFCRAYQNLCSKTWKLLKNSSLEQNLMTKSLNYNHENKGITNNKQANIYLLKVNKRNTRDRCEICSKLTIKISKYQNNATESVLLFLLNIFHTFC